MTTTTTSALLTTTLLLTAAACADHSDVDDLVDMTGTSDATDSAETGGDDETARGSEGSETADPEPAALCGNGLLEAGEECDDGNASDNDDCTNNCLENICGDGLVNELEEECDDGNEDPGDSCTASCELAGTVVWTRQYEDIGCAGRKVAVNNFDYAYVIGGCTTPTLFLFSPDGELLWEKDIEQDAVHDLALDTYGNVLVAGRKDSNELEFGHTAKYDQVGNLLWSNDLPAGGSHVVAMAVTPDDGVTVVADAGLQAVLASYEKDGTHASYALAGSLPVYGLGLGAPGEAVLLRADEAVTGLWLETGAQLWSSTVPDAAVANTMTISDGRIYISSFNDLSSFSVHQMTGDGSSVEWSAVHDTSEYLEAVKAMAPLPGGGVLVAGATNYDGQNAETDGLLSWYSADGTNFLDVVVDGPQNNDTDMLNDVSTNRDFAVALGSHETADGTSLWLVKVAI